jgi:heat-inducible transcriptional repressor
MGSDTLVVEDVSTRKCRVLTEESERRKQTVTEHSLSDRKMKILHAVIQNYLETGEPVGSRTISKYTDLNLSSATIRNEMADLEELGYIMQPHTSAGRIPSDKGYRLYVDMLMEEKEQELNEMQEQMLDKADRMEQLLKQAARVLASNTNYATMVSTPMNNANKIKFIQLSMVDAEQVIAVIVLGGNVIKSKIIRVDEALSNENLLKLNMLLNTTLNGMSIEEINLGLIARLKEQAGIHSSVISNVLDAVADAIQIDEDMQIYTSGATNIFKYPELSDNQSAQEIINAFEEKQQLTELVTQTLAKDDNTGIQVYIGDETPVQTMKDCSVVTATYELGDGMKGTIGIIGPKRMDYEHVLKSMKRLQNELDQMFHKKE